MDGTDSATTRGWRDQAEPKATAALVCGSGSAPEPASRPTPPAAPYSAPAEPKYASRTDGSLSNWWAGASRTTRPSSST
jgi:hypothetical protein